MERRFLGMNMDTQPVNGLQNIENLMDQWVAEQFFGRPFFIRLAAGEWNTAQLRYFAMQYGHYSRQFPRVLGAAIAAMPPHVQWWLPLADNLWDEAGRGVPGKSHQALYQTFLASVVPDLMGNGDAIDASLMSPAVREAIETFIRFFRQATPLQAMAAVGLGSEFFAGRVMGAIGQGLGRLAVQPLPPLNLTFWRIHAEYDEPRHYQLCQAILKDFTKPEELASMLQVGKSIAGSEAAMYDGLWQEMARM